MRLEFDKEGKHYFETGVDRGVLYLPKEDSVTKKISYTDGEAFDGLRSVENNPEGGEITDFYADNIKYLSLTSAEKLKITIGCYYYPEGFKECNGEKELAKGVTVGQQTRKAFGFCYRSKLGNDITEDLGYKLHLLYGCKCAPTSKAYNTVNDSPEAAELSFEVSASPIDITKVKGFKPTYELTIDSTTIDEAKLTALEDMLYGKDAAEGQDEIIPHLPTPDEVYDLLNPKNKATTTIVTKIPNAPKVENKDNK